MSDSTDDKKEKKIPAILQTTGRVTSPPSEEETMKISEMLALIKRKRKEHYEGLEKKQAPKAEVQKTDEEDSTDGK
ncbi:hypothetical protein ACFL6N_02860 [Thermodesulfobacteriota bacterium]